jgi:hypothetical protein
MKHHKQFRTATTAAIIIAASMLTPAIAAFGGKADVMRTCRNVAPVL